MLRYSFIWAEEQEISKLLSTLSDTSQPDEVRQRALQQLMAHEKEVQEQLRNDFYGELTWSPKFCSRNQVTHTTGSGYKCIMRTSPALNLPARISLFRKWASIAAAALLCIGSAWLFQHKADRPTGNSSLALLASVNAIDSFDTIWNAGTSTSFHRLQDGSTVHLEAGSTIFFRDTFPAGNKGNFPEWFCTFYR